MVRVDRAKRTNDLTHRLKGAVERLAHDASVRQSRFYRVVGIRVGRAGRKQAVIRGICQVVSKAPVQFHRCLDVNLHEPFGGLDGHRVRYPKRIFDIERFHHAQPFEVLVLHRVVKNGYRAPVRCLLVLCRRDLLDRFKPSSALWCGFQIACDGQFKSITPTL
ncbi:hypothetical protein H257_10902 [Aphanomyces astaci]|uniref:Uncharacterized protein n=1 Tax=Aphanomyces astaci TaxID=112090 RepID=W4G7C6_APHAT|nr:hypothetical protein H257_10902 [Aphanomyces astaci]ETV74863.1 hypothetical protein H257_10902 [Aphanomyces astaci]|eukprot:XP_009835950.1 hypothetical protein H257_10902 [Aphanomyces astaci]